MRHRKLSLIDRIKLAGSALVITAAGILGCDSGGSPGVPAVNEPPVITSSPDDSVAAGDTYSYDMDANDPNGDDLTYSLISGPSWMDIDPDTGVLSGVPSETDLGPQTVTTGVDDGEYLVEEDFSVLVHSPLEDVVGKYVIVTSEALAPNYEALKVWKENKGYDAEIITIEDIVASETGRDTQEKIRERIKSIKLANMSKDVYVLLGGDVEVVPHRQVTATCSFDPPGPETELTDDTIPCDGGYYGDLFIDGTTTASVWDGNSDNVFGRLPEDNPDLHSDVYVGRAPVNTDSEADNFVRKSLDYEQNHDMSNVGDVTFCATMLDGDSDAKLAKSWINPNVYDFSANGFTVTGFYESDGNGDVSSVMNNLESGPHLVNIYTHGSEETNNLSDGTLNSNGSYPAGDIRTLTNSSSTSKDFIYKGLGCHSNHLDNTALFPTGDCVLEELINNPNGGAVACMGTSRIGLFNAASPAGVGNSWEYDCEFVRSLFTKNIDNLGKAFADSKDVYAELSKTGMDYRWIQLCLNLLGDPALTVWKANLGTITATTTSGTNYTGVNTNTPGARVCLNDGTNVYSAMTNINGDVIFNATPSSYTITATKKDWKPYTE